MPIKIKMCQSVCCGFLDTRLIWLFLLQPQQGGTSTLNGVGRCLILGGQNVDKKTQFHSSKYFDSTNIGGAGPPCPPPPSSSYSYDSNHQKNLSGNTDMTSCTVLMRN